MSISSRITEMEEHIRNAYDKIEDLGIDTTNTNKNINNISSILETVWNEQPKVLGQGTNIVLKNTRKGKMKLDINGNTEQDATILPNEYQQVEYIESTGTQYIDTGIKPNSNTGINIKAITDNSFTGIDSIVVGSRDSSGNRCFIYLPTSSNTFAIAWNTNHTFSKVLTVNTEYNIFMNYNNDKKVYINNEEISFTFEEFAGNNYNMFLFVTNSAGTPTSFFKGKIKRCKITNGTLLQRDFIPCYRKSDNEIGLFDLVTNTFFTNAGTGTFLKGNDITIPNSDFPQQIKNVTGNANVKIQNKNLAWTGWAEDFVNRVNNSNNASITIEDNRNCLFYKNSIGGTMVFNQDWKANTQYTFSFYIKANYSPNLIIEYTDGTTTQLNRSLITINSWSKIEVTSSANKTIKYLRGINEGGNDYIDLDTFMVEEGTTATTYVPHQEQNYPLTLGDIELCEIDTAQDYFYKENGKWYKHKEINKVIFNGSEQWERQQPGHTNVINLYVNLASYGSAVENSKVFCNIAKYGSAGANNDSLINICQPNSIGSNFLIDLSLEEFPSIESFKAYLQKNNMELIYKLKTPVNIEITDTALIEQLEATLRTRSYDDITYITSTSDELGFNMNAAGLEKSVNQVLGGSY